MKRKQLLLLLALLMTAATGAWAQDAKHLITATYDKQTSSLEQPLPYETTVGALYEAVTGKSFSDLISTMSLLNKTLTGISSTKTDVVSIGGLNGASTPVTVKADGKAAVAINFSGYAKGIFVSVTPPLYVTMKEGVKDADKWTVKVGEGQAQALPIGGLKGDGSETVTLQYNGRLKVKSVKATSDAGAPAAAAFAADEYNEASWDDTNKKVVFEKKKATTTPTAVANSNTAVTWSDGWYTVAGEVTIGGNVTLTADTYLILQDGATLTINGQLNARDNQKNLYIYGQKKGDGKLNVICSSSGDEAIYGKIGKTVEIHGGEITAEGNGGGLTAGYIKVFSGKITATCGSKGDGVVFNNSCDVYGGEIEATTNNNNSRSVSTGISDGGNGGTFTVYGGKVKATGNGVDQRNRYGSGFEGKVKSGTAGIKFYFSDNGTDWDEGTYYETATAAPQKKYAKAE